MLKQYSLVRDLKPAILAIVPNFKDPWPLYT